MISEIRIQNFKSIRDLVLKPGRVTVLIGENGSGKSNLLEAIAFAAGASADKLDNEYLFNRGIRVTEEAWMRSAFPPLHAPGGETNERVALTIASDPTQPPLQYHVCPRRLADDGSFAGWLVESSDHSRDFIRAMPEHEFRDRFKKYVAEAIANGFGSLRDADSAELEGFELLAAKIFDPNVLAGLKVEQAKRLGLADFMIYAPENTTLRTPPPESAIQPLGCRGEGLLKLLQSFSDPRFADRLADLKDRLRLFGWFEDFLTPDDSATMQARLQIRDRWLAPDRAVFDQRSANEGFLYVLFYFTLLMSWRTPRFFALDNVDNALNPRLCTRLMKQIAELATKYDKQVLCTTHNPAILDGLDLNDDAQRLYAVRRDSEGHTVVRRIRAPQPQPGEAPVRLSEAFVRGILGGLPDHF